MNWEAVGAIGEILGAIGVIVTLAYLAVQIRQNTRASKAATVQNMTDKWVQINLFLAEHDPKLALLADPEADRRETSKAVALYRALFHQWSNNLYQYQQGVLDETLFQPTMQDMRRFLRGSASESFQVAWSLARHIYNDEFAALVDRIVEEETGAA